MPYGRIHPCRKQHWALDACEPREGVGIGTVLRILPFDRVVDAWQEGV